MSVTGIHVTFHFDNNYSTDWSFFIVFQDVVRLLSSNGAWRTPDQSISKPIEANRYMVFKR